MDRIPDAGVTLDDCLEAEYLRQEYLAGTKVTLTRVPGA